MIEETLICPYCGKVQYTHDPDDISGDMCYTICEYCEKPFWYAVEVVRTYSAYKDDSEE